MFSGFCGIEPYLIQDNFVYYTAEPPPEFWEWVEYQDKLRHPLFIHVGHFEITVKIIGDKIKWTNISQS